MKDQKFKDMAFCAALQGMLTSGKYFYNTPTQATQEAWKYAEEALRLRSTVAVDKDPYDYEERYFRVRLQATSLSGQTVYSFVDTVAQTAAAAADMVHGHVCFNSSEWHLHGGGPTAYDALPSTLKILSVEEL